MAAKTCPINIYMAAGAPRTTPADRQPKLGEPSQPGEEVTLQSSEAAQPSLEAAVRSSNNQSQVSPEQSNVISLFMNC